MAKLYLSIDSLDKASHHLRTPPPQAQAISFGSSGARPNWPCERARAARSAAEYSTSLRFPRVTPKRMPQRRNCAARSWPALLEFSAARQHWERAEQRRRAAGTFGPAERCQRRQIELVMRGIGNVVEAEAIFDAIDPERLKGALELALRLELLRIECLARGDSLSVARDAVQTWVDRVG